MIYVPNSSYACYVIQDQNTIRAYHSTPRTNSTITYTDYYINSHYLERTNTQTFGNTINVNCLSSSLITDEVYYRNDFDSILIIFLILCIFCFYLPLKIFSKLFKRGNL